MHIPTVIRLAALALLSLTLLIAAHPTHATSRHFPETNQSVTGRFLQYWESHGGLAQQGFPISPEFREKSDLNGKSYTVQYFERAVFEYHPENEPPHDVLLSQLGTFVYKQKYPEGAAQGEPPPGEGSQLFPETGRTVHGLFLTYWQEHGGLAQQGFPISETFIETSPLDGKPYTVQYFERAVFEHHPENQPPHDVLLSQLGTFRLKEKHNGTAPATGVLKITTVYNGSKEENNREYAELTNTGSAPQDLAGWMLTKVSKNLIAYRFPAGTQLAPGATLRIISGPQATASAPNEYVWRTAPVWCNEGDAATLLDPEGTIADRLFYGKPVDLANGKTACSR
jgi:hypothetical protein